MVFFKLLSDRVRVETPERYKYMSLHSDHRDLFLLLTTPRKKIGAKTATPVELFHGT